MWSKGSSLEKREKAKEELPADRKAPVVKKVTQIHKKPLRKNKAMISRHNRFTKKEKVHSNIGGDATYPHDGR